jgi:anti-sigma factor RsiW
MQGSHDGVPNERELSDDELLSAYVDGALSDESRAALQSRLERDPELALRLAGLQLADDAVRHFYPAAIDEPLPPAVAELLGTARDSGPSELIDLTARRAARAGTSSADSSAVTPMRWAALAAGVALAIGFGLGLQLARTDTEPGAVQLAAVTAIPADSALHDALERAPSMSARDIASEVSVTPELSFRAIDGGYCRQITFEGSGTAAEALACRRNGSWQIDALSATVTPASPGDGGEFRLARRPGSAIEAVIDERIDGDPLDPAREQALIGSGWSD